MMLAVNDGTGLQYLLTDHLGSTVAVTNQSGTLTSQQRYLPFGAPRTIPNSPILGTDFTFTGQRDLGDMGLMDYDARFYSQSLGRFIQPDTLIPSVAIPQTWNRYAYSINNPIKFVDPTGHFIETLFDVAMILVDVADIAKNGLNVSNGAALVLDVAAVIIPGVPAVAGLTIKAAKAANAVDNAMDAAKVANAANDTFKTLYHATDVAGAKSILENGIDLAKGRLNLDFNPAGKEGFYVTEILDQAKTWASRYGEDGRIVQFNVPKNKLNELSGKIFSSGDDEWLEFVLAGRNGELNHSFDFVEGPYLSLKNNKPFGHQLAIFTQKAVKLFNNSIMGIAQ